MNDLIDSNLENPVYIEDSGYKVSYTSVDGDEIEVCVGKFIELGELDDRGVPLDKPDIGESEFPGYLVYINRELAEKVKGYKTLNALLLNKGKSELERLVDSEADSEELIQTLNELVDNFVEGDYIQDDDELEPNQYKEDDTWGYPSDFRTGEYED